jgi:hypothetical protein
VLVLEIKFDLVLYLITTMICSWSKFCLLVGLSAFPHVLSQQPSPLVPARILIYSATADYRHDSIPTAIQALKDKGSSINVVFDNSEDKTLFTDQGLAVYDALLFLDNTGEGSVPLTEQGNILTSMLQCSTIRERQPFRIIWTLAAFLLLYMRRLMVSETLHFTVGK